MHGQKRLGRVQMCYATSCVDAEMMLLPGSGGINVFARLHSRVHSRCDEIVSFDERRVNCSISRLHFVDDG